jgi:hypothetical protein
MNQVLPRKIKLMMTVILLATGTGGVIMSGILDEPFIAILGSINLAFAAFIGVRYLNSRSEKEKK